MSNYVKLQFKVFTRYLMIFCSALPVTRLSPQWLCDNFVAFVSKATQSFWSVKLLHKESSIIEHCNTSKGFKQRKQLICNLKSHADIAAIFSQIHKMLNLQYHGIFTSKFSRNSLTGNFCPVIWWATEKEKPTSQISGNSNFA